jgi:uncharacterized MAPEG superfamily protein
MIGIDLEKKPQKKDINNATDETNMNASTLKTTVSSYSYNSLSFAMALLGITLVILHYRAVFASIDGKRRFAEDEKTVATMAAKGYIDPIVPADQMNGIESAGGTVETPEGLRKGSSGERWANIKENQNENFPIAFIIFYIASSVAGGSVAVASTTSDNKPCMIAVTFMIWIYIVTRIVYIPCYLYGLQPYRTLVFSISLLSVISAAIMLPYMALTFTVPDDGK